MFVPQEIQPEAEHVIGIMPDGSAERFDTSEEYRRAFRDELRRIRKLIDEALELYPPVCEVLGTLRTPHSTTQWWNVQ